MKLRYIALATALASLSVTAYADEWAPYFGIGGGVQYLDQNTSISNLTSESGIPQGQSSTPVYFYNHHSGGVLNAYAGIGHFDNRLYTALEFDLYYNPANYSSSTVATYLIPPPPLYQNTQTMTASIPWRFGLAGILGYQVTQQWLPYARLAAEIGHLQTGYTSITPADTQSPIYSEQYFSQNLFGGTIGIGSRYYLVPHFFIAIEGDYTRYLNENSQQASIVFLGHGEPYYHSEPYNYQFQTGIYSLIASMGYQF